MAENGHDARCKECGAAVPEVNQFCGSCGAKMVLDNDGADHWLVRLLDSEGVIESSAAVMPGTQVIGGDERADITIDEDRCVSPRHAFIRLLDAEVSLEDSGSRNGVFRPVREPVAAGHNDLIRAGGQLFRLQLIERLGPEPVIPLPHPLFGPARPAWGRLLRYNRHGYVSESRLLDADNFEVGRQEGDWTLRRARTMSSRHFAIQRDDDGAITIHDQNSRNGSYVEVSGAVSISSGDQFLIGDRLIQFDAMTLKDFHLAIRAGDSLEIQEAEALDPAAVFSEKTYEAIPEEIIEAALEESIPPIVFNDSEPAEEAAPLAAEPASEEEIRPDPKEVVQPDGDEASLETEPIAAAEVEPDDRGEEPAEEPAEEPIAMEPDAAVDHEAKTRRAQPASDLPSDAPAGTDDPPADQDWAAAALADFQDETDGKE